MNECLPGYRSGGDDYGDAGPTRSGRAGRRRRRGWPGIAGMPVRSCSCGGRSSGESRLPRRTPV